MGTEGGAETNQRGRGERNALARAEGLFGLPKSAGRDLERKIREQFRLGYKGLDAGSMFLLEEDVEDILQSDVQVARGWLSSVLIARGILVEAEEEAGKSYRVTVSTPYQTGQLWVAKE